ncbi:MAG TPA: hypothetical protein VKY66_06685 [Protaetiibacter sp.]|nr:hypothetical protein [Protaetiibacter sp.]
MVDHEHRTRAGRLVEPGELAAKERARLGRDRGVRTQSLPIIRPVRAPGAPDAEPAETDEVPRSA